MALSFDGMVARAYITGVNQEFSEKEPRMKKSLLIALALLFIPGISAQAACTAEQARQKSLDYATALQEKSRTAPEAYREFAKKHQEKAMELQKDPANLDALCNYYDAALKELGQ